MVEMGGKRPFAEVLMSTTKSLPTVGGKWQVASGKAELKPSAKEVIIKPFAPKLKSTVKSLALRMSMGERAPEGKGREGTVP